MGCSRHAVLDLRSGSLVHEVIRGVGVTPCFKIPARNAVCAEAYTRLVERRPALLRDIIEALAGLAKRWQM